MVVTRILVEIWMEKAILMSSQTEIRNLLETGKKAILIIISDKQLGSVVFTVFLCEVEFVNDNEVNIWPKKFLSKMLKEQFGFS